MFTQRRRRRPLNRLEPGDRSALQEYHPWHLFSRSLFFLELDGEARTSRFYAVDVRHFADEIPEETDAEEPLVDDEDRGAGTWPAALYRDGVQLHRSNLPATFPVPGGLIEVATSMYGLSRMHYVRDDGSQRQLIPHRRSHEGLRARFTRRYPRTSSVIGIAAVLILLVGLAVSIPQGVELLTRIDSVAVHTGSFTSPIHLPDWANITVLVSGFIAAFERALTLRNHWLIDLDTSWSAFT